MKPINTIERLTEIAESDPMIGYQVSKYLGAISQYRSLSIYFLRHRRDLQLVRKTRREHAKKLSEVSGSIAELENQLQSAASQNLVDECVQHKTELANTRNNLLLLTNQSPEAGLAEEIGEGLIKDMEERMERYAKLRATISRCRRVVSTISHVLFDDVNTVLDNLSKFCAEKNSGEKTVTEISPSTSESILIDLMLRRLSLEQKGKTS